MADWKQIQARIRKARNSSDPVARLAELYAKTRDGMAAFEVGAAAEKAARMEEAIHWYATAHGRFRRNEWRIKAAEALTRLGAPVPPTNDSPFDAHDGRDGENSSSATEIEHGTKQISALGQPPEPAPAPAPATSPRAASSRPQQVPSVTSGRRGRAPVPREWLHVESGAAPQAKALGDDTTISSAQQDMRAEATFAEEIQGNPAGAQSAREKSGALDLRQDVPADSATEINSPAPPLANGSKRRRRGRRGGHGRQPGLSPAKFAQENSAASQSEGKPLGSPKPSTAESPLSAQRRASFAPQTEKLEPALPMEAAQAEKPVPPYRSPSRSRLADPGVSSRLAQLEALLRRLISAPEHPLSEAEEAPAGPGVFVLSDSDLVTFYYVEACRTLRVAIGNLAKGRNIRGGRTRSAPAESSPIRARLSEHLDISEAKVSQYMKQHCVVRWLQLDDEAHHLAHLTIAVLRPPLNSE